MFLRLLIATVLLAGAFGTASAADPAYKEDETAVAAVEKAGGRVVRYYPQTRRPGVAPPPEAKDRADVR